MTRALGTDPARRCLPTAEWPSADRDIWAAALREGDILEPGGERFRHAPGSNRAVEGGYGRWLAWLAHAGLLEARVAPADRITPERVVAYLETLAEHNGTATRARRLEELFIVAQLADRERDWCWIRDIRGRVRRRHLPTREKRARLVGAEDLVDLGHSLMRQAESEADAAQPSWRCALLFRDGLALAVLALRPLRRANFVALRLGEHLAPRGTTWWIRIDGRDTKTGTPIEVPWPETLAEALESYISIWRPILLTRRTPNGAGAQSISHLWLSARGGPLDTQGLFDLTGKRTRAAFGRPVSPHLFRDCAATAIAIEDPIHIGIAAQILGHRSLATTERHYNQARSAEAACRWQSTLARLRGLPPEQETD